MRRLGLALALATFAAAPGCHKSDGFDEGMPETAGYTLELTGNESQTQSGSSVGAQAQALSGQEAVGAALGRTKDAIEDLNSGIHEIFDPLAALIGSTSYTLAGDARVYVFERGAVHYRFEIARVVALHFLWKLDARPVSGTDAQLVRVMSGAFARGDEIRRGRGIVGIDLSNLASVDASFHGTGQVLVAFAHVAGHKILRFALKDFSADVTRWETVSALFSGWRGPLGGTDVRVAGYGNIESTATPAKELLVMHARWRADLGGRVDATAAGGDVPAGHGIVEFACYNAHNLATEGYLLVADCDVVAQSCSPVETTGVITNCLPDLQQDVAPSTDPNTAPLPAEAPEDPGVPTAMPST